jgi:hypothetical protein
MHRVGANLRKIDCDLLGPERVSGHVGNGGGLGMLRLVPVLVLVLALVLTRKLDIVYYKTTTIA